jgi:hypothetical protein
MSPPTHELLKLDNLAKPIIESAKVQWYQRTTFGSQNGPIPAPETQTFAAEGEKASTGEGNQLKSGD